MKGSIRPSTLAFAFVFGLGLASPSSVRADDEVLYWNAVLQRAIITAGAAAPGPVQGRLAAIVHVAMFDALNGIERRHTSIHVDADAPRGASRRAAVVQAAYTALVGLFPSQAAAFAQDLETSLAAIADDDGIEHSAAYVLAHAAQPVKGKHTGQLRK
jgi:hypothetical protein